MVLITFFLLGVFIFLSFLLLSSQIVVSDGVALGLDIGFTAVFTVELLVYIYIYIYIYI